MLKGRRVLRSTAPREQPKTPENSLNSEFSTLWTNSFHCVENSASFFHSVETYFPLCGKLLGPRRPKSSREGVRSVFSAVDAFHRACYAVPRWHGWHPESALGEKPNQSKTLDILYFALLQNSSHPNPLLLRNERTARDAPIGRAFVCVRFGA